MSSFRSRTIALAPVALALLASCGGGDGSSDQRASVTERTGPTAPATTAPEQGASGATDAQKGSSGGSKAPAQPKPRAKPKPRTNAGLEVLKREAEKLKKKAGKIKKQSKGGDSSPKKKTPAKPAPGGTPSQVLRAKAKRVCGNMGVAALAQKYSVAADPEAVATAYAQTYPAPLQTAVHNGCISGLAGR
jgi:hypothetical protein